MKADLHVHSTASDGTCSPAELVELALHNGVSHLSLTDHDSVEGIAEATLAAQGSSLTLIPGVELSSVTLDGRDVHVLGYFIDPTDCRLRELLAELRAARLRRAEAIVASLAAADLHVDLSEVLSLANGGSVGRSHVARALVSTGHAESMRDAFSRLIGRGRPHYVSKDVRLPQDAIRAIRDAGGLAVVAHPGINELDDLVRAMSREGLAGVEAYHADHTPDQRTRYATLATELGLLATGGSDFHGPAAPNPSLGSIALPESAIAAFMAAGTGR